MRKRKKLADACSCGSELGGTASTQTSLSFRSTARGCGAGGRGVGDVSAEKEVILSSESREASLSVDRGRGGGPAARFLVWVACAAGLNNPRIYNFLAVAPPQLLDAEGCWWCGSRGACFVCLRGGSPRAASVGVSDRKGGHLFSQNNLLRMNLIYLTRTPRFKLTDCRCSPSPAEHSHCCARVSPIETARVGLRLTGSTRPKRGEQAAAGNHLVYFSSFSFRIWQLV